MSPGHPWMDPTAFLRAVECCLLDGFFVLKTLPLLWGDFLLYDVPVRRLIESESKLKRLEDKVSFQEVDVKLDRVPVELYREGKQLTTELLEGGKTKLTREEPKDYSRVIAANMIVETNLRRTWLDNVTRVLVGSVGVGLAYFYKRVLDKREAEQDRREEELNAGASRLRSEQEIARKELDAKQLRMEEEAHQDKLLLNTKYQHIQHIIDDLERENEELSYGWRLAEGYIYKLCNRSGARESCFDEYQNYREEMKKKGSDECRQIKSVLEL